MAHERDSFWRRLDMLLALVALLWVVEVVDQLIFGRALDGYGIRPRQVDALLGIVWAPFLHGSFGHLAANTIPLLVLGTLLLVRGPGDWISVTILGVLLGGIGVWAIGVPNTVHIGASGLIFAYLGYLLLAAIFQASLGSILIAVVAGFLYGGIVWGMLPTQPDVSWEGHLSGFLGGAVSAWARSSPTPHRR